MSELILGTCPGTACYNHDVSFEIDADSKYCPICGRLLRANDAPSAPASFTTLHDVLTRYEGAVSATERDGDDSDEAVAELEAARTALMDLLREAKVNLP